MDSLVAVMGRRGWITLLHRRERAKAASGARRRQRKHRQRNHYRIRRRVRIINLWRSLMTQTLLFDLSSAKAKRNQGQSLASANRSDVLRYAQGIAVSIAKLRDDRCVSADDVYRHLSLDQARQLGNAAGSLFRGPQWEFTGRREQSQRITNHARWIMVWRLLRPGDSRAII